MAARRRTMSQLDDWRIGVSIPLFSIATRDALVLRSLGQGIGLGVSWREWSTIPIGSRSTG